MDDLSVVNRPKRQLDNVCCHSISSSKIDILKIENDAILSPETDMSLPEVHRAENVEMIRDGGSWSATFSDKSSHRYILFFQIRRTEQGGFYTPKQHLSPPFIIDCDPTLRPENYSQLAGPRTPVSWERARKILRNIREEKTDLTGPERSFHYEEWLQEMIEVANREGAPI